MLGNFSSEVIIVPIANILEEAKIWIIQILGNELNSIQYLENNGALIPAIITGGIVGTTLSISIYSNLRNTLYRRNTLLVLFAALSFALAALFILIYVDIYDKLLFFHLANAFLISGVIFIPFALYPLYKTFLAELAAEETGQIPIDDPPDLNSYIDDMMKYHA